MGTNITIIGERINKIQKMMDTFLLATICWANRSCNSIADFICKNAIEKNCNWDFNIDYPVEIHELVI
ncbi:hypothetical protein Gotri_026998, partial [Gossypium trilobum]|nr:hypothetical protein [Gossypium trilobum]